MSEQRPKRNEGGLCPGLEAVMRDVATGLESEVQILHLDHDGPWQSCPYAYCSSIRFYSDKLRAGLAEWTGRS